MLLDVGRFGFSNKHVGFVGVHLAAANHVMDELASAFNGKRREACRRAHDIAHRAGHTAAGLEADFVRPPRHLGGRIAGVSAAMPRAATRRWRRWCWGFGFC